MKLSDKKFITSDNLFSHLKDLIKSGTKLKFEVEDISYGDRYYNENGESINFKIAGKEYRVGYSYITEDDDEWAQAECHKVTWCDCDDRHVDAAKVLEIVDNWESIERDYKLEKIVKS